MLLLANLLLAASIATALPRRGTIDPSSNFLISATPSAFSDSNITYPDLCVISSTSGTYYIGSTPGCQQTQWTIQNSALTTPLTNADGQSVLYGSNSLDIPNLTLAGEFVTFSPEAAAGDVRGDYGLEPNDILYVPDAGGEFSNWWLCPLPDGSEGVALKYGFHHGYGTPAEEADCNSYIIKAVEPVTGKE